MISLEQVQLLEEKVSKAVGYVERLINENRALTQENLFLKEKVNSIASENAELVSAKKELAKEKDTLVLKLETNQKRIDELEVHILRFKEDQGRIEDGIMSALDRLSQFEEAFEKSLKDTKKPSVNNKKPENKDKPAPVEEAAPAENAAPDNKEIFFEIPKEDESVEDESSQDTELDIF